MVKPADPTDKPAALIGRFNKGDRIRQSRPQLNSIVDAVNTMIPRMGPAKQVKPTPQSPGVTILPMKITGVPSNRTTDGDFILCREFLPDGTIDIEADDIPVARNFLCRRLPFDMGTLKTRLGVSYSYSNSTQRTATIDEVSITEVITPSYFGLTQALPPLGIHADVVLCLYFPGGVKSETGWQMRYGSGSSSVAVNWLDLNVDGRSWAKETG